MNKHDAETIIAIATMAALSDNHHDEHELKDIADAAERLGLPRGAAVDAPMTPSLRLLINELSDADARRTAYDVAVAVCNGQGPANPQEVAFLRELATGLQIDTTSTDSAVSAALANPAMNWAPPAIAAAANAAMPVATSAASTAATTPPATSTSEALDTHILDQAMLTAALELLPDRLANIGSDACPRYSYAGNFGKAIG